MANPLWVPGAESANPTGRPKNSSRTAKGMIERFIKRNISPNRLAKLYDKLTPTQQAEFILALIPYVVPKLKEDGISKQEVDQLFATIQEALTKQQHGKVS